MPAPDHRPGTPTWVDLMTPDVAAARAFYGELFGWTFETGPENYTMCKLGGRDAAGIGEQPPGAPFPSAWNLYLAVTSVDETLAKVRAAGGAVVMGPMDAGELGRFAFCADPTGAHFGLWEARAHCGATVAGEAGSMCWHEVNTRDSAAARAFYAEVFGLEAEKLPGEMAYWTLRAGDTEICAGILEMDSSWPADVPPHWMSYFAVTDTDAAVAAIPRLGGKVCVPPFDTPHGRMAVVNDPGGATFSIIAPTEHKS